MGCGSSRDAPQQGPRPLQIGAPQDMMMHVPAPRLDAVGNPIRVQDYDIDNQTLDMALRNVARYLHSRGEDLTIICSGGVINLLFPKTRQTTHDVDFFGTNLNNSQRRMLSEAARYAEQQTSRPLGEEWLNNEMMLWLAPDVHRALTHTALQRNIVVFQAQGLKVVAAPWSYAFCSKLNRVADPRTRRAYDTSDAVSYLHEILLQRRDRRPVSVQDVQGWASQYGLQVQRNALRDVAQLYQQRYRRVGLTGV